MINFLRSLLPQNTPPSIEKRGDLAILRERIFQGIMLVVAAIIIIAYFFLLSENLIAQNWLQALTLTIASILVLAFTFIRKIPFVLRATLLILALLASSILTYISAGTISNAKIYLIASGVLASVFLGLIPGLVTIGLGLGITLLFTIGIVPDWISDAIFFAVIGALASISVALLVSSLQASIKKHREVSQDLEYERLNMGLRVEQSVSALERRLTQIRTAAEIGRAISSNLDPQTLLQQVVDLIQERFNLYYVGLFLLDESKKYAVLQAGTGQAGKDMVAENYRLPIAESSMIGWSVIFQKPRIAQDVGQETVHFRNPHLPLTQSEMALPFISRGTSLGSVSIQSTTPNAFDENDILILQSIVDALSVAFENARLFQQSRKDLEEIRALNREYLQKSWAEVGETYGNIEFAYQNPLQLPRSQENPKKDEDDEGQENTLPVPPGRTIELPITLRDEVIGQISIESEAEDYSPAQLEFVEAIALQTALALDNARLIEKTQRSAIQEQTLSQISAQFSQALSVEEILKTAVKELGRLPEISEVTVHLIPPADDHATITEPGSQSPASFTEAPAKDTTSSTDGDGK